MSKDTQWKYSETEINQEDYLKNESLMTVSNGYLSLRGSYEEGNMSYGHQGTYLNGLYEFHDLHYGEKFTAYPDKSQVMVNLPDPKTVKFKVNGESLSLETSKISSYHRELDLRSGILKREFVWETYTGAKAKICSTRFASSVEKHLICIKYEIQFYQGEGDYSIESTIDTNRHNISKEDDPRIGVEFNHNPIVILSRGLEDELMFLNGETYDSKQKFNVYLLNEYNVDGIKVDTETGILQDQFGDDTSIILYKYIWLDKNETRDSKRAFIALKNKGYRHALDKHSQWWKQQWEHMDVVIKGDKLMQKAIRLNLYHLTQNVGKDGLTNISAKGMTGEGYEGHYFWDTEIYMLPFFVYTNPDIAKSLLMYRYNTLEQARSRARQMGHKQGVLYPWRTINGEECSSFFPAGTAQYHINADIAYGIKLYYEATNDWKFIQDYGMEILLELANLWLDMGQFDHQGRFCIHEVTGPDEYSCLVNNNTYTNIMVKNEIEFLLSLIEKCQEESSGLSLKSMELIQTFEVERAKRVIEHMYLAYDDTLKIYAQDDGFLSKPVWDFAETPKEKYPLLMHYHPLTLYRHQVCKQADVVLAELLQPTMFTPEQKKRDFDYYEKITTHDSSLSNCIYGIMAAELGDLEKSYEYYMKTAKTDIEDVHQNAKDGIHAANMAGSWLGIVYGFAGLRIKDGELTFNSKIPKNWEEYSFHLRFKNQVYEIKVNQNDVKIIEKNC